MSIMKKIFLFCALAVLNLLMVGCKPELSTEDSTQERTISIKDLSIKNTTCLGLIDEKNGTIIFDGVPAETPIENLQFVGEWSLGSYLDKESYNFYDPTSENPKEAIDTIKLVNNDLNLSKSYVVIIYLDDPIEAPKLAKLVMKTNDGEVIQSIIKEDTVFLQMPGKESATLENIELYPTRSSYELDSLLKKGSDDNKLRVKFMGLESEYVITFDLAAAPGADFANPTVHDFSVTGGNPYSAFANENTRGSDFDGEHVLIVSRSDDTIPTHHLLKVSDLINGITSPIELSKEGVGNSETDQYVVSAGRLSHGHIYVCNLVTALGNGHTLKVYHYADANATPDLWEWDGFLGMDEVGDSIKAISRLGDNMSINLDENGNGYAFFCAQEASAERMYRVEIANFNEFSNPTEIILGEAFPYYGYVNKVANNQYLLTSHYMASTWLIDKDGTLITDIYFQSTEAGLKPQTGVDPHVVKFNNGYYLIFASPYNNTKRLGVGPALYMVDITEGAQVNIAKGLQDLSDELWEDEEGIWEPDYHYSLDQANIEAETRKTVAACAAQCNAAEVDGKLLVYAAAVGAGFVIIEFPAAK